jgi:hypothetical protein
MLLSLLVANSAAKAYVGRHKVSDGWSCSKLIFSTATTFDAHLRILTLYYVLIVSRTDFPDVNIFTYPSLEDSLVVIVFLCAQKVSLYILNLTFAHYPSSIADGFSFSIHCSSSMLPIRVEEMSPVPLQSLPVLQELGGT